MEGENNLIDQLEDSIIRHLDESVAKGESLDESFQSKLNQRASQIQSGLQWSLPHDPGSTNGPSGATSYRFLQKKPELCYTHNDVGTLQLELSDWFVSADYALIGLSHLENLPKDLPEDFSLSVELNYQSSNLNQLLYFVLGSFSEEASDEQHVSSIKANCHVVASGALAAEVVQLLSQALSQLMTDDAGTGCQFQANYMKLLTAMYFITCCTLDANSKPDSLMTALANTDLMVKLVALVETCNAKPRPSVRLRSCIQLLSKLLLLEFGTSKGLSNVKNYLEGSEKASNRLDEAQDQTLLSPIEYFTFHEDLVDKYPLAGQGISHNGSAGVELQKEKEAFMATNAYSNSLSNLMSIPRTNKLHSILGNMPTQTVHLATPVPSPPTTPSDFMSGGEKLRKLYHINQGMPLIYPYEETQPIPKAIHEATGLVTSKVQQTVLSRRLQLERDQFLTQERGYRCDEPVDAAKELTKRLQDQQHCAYLQEVKSLLRVELFYKTSLPYLRGLVEVLLSVIKANKTDIPLRDIELELDPGISFTQRFGADTETRAKFKSIILSRLETLRAKETTLKATATILRSLLDWFKQSHVLKQYYLSSILFDSKYLNIFVDFLSDSFNNPSLQKSPSENKALQLYDVVSAQNRLMNPAIEIPSYNFFAVAKHQKTSGSGIRHLINQLDFNDFPQMSVINGEYVVKIEEFNVRFAHTLVNLLSVTDEVLIKNVSQRILAFNETKPTDLLKLILLNYTNDCLRTPILNVFKKLTPYQGRKWRALNMDVVSLVYLHLDLSLKDDWLSGRDLESDLNESLDQELSLRSLLQFYNIRRYPDEYRNLGYSVNK